MSKQWQIRRGTTAENDIFTGAQGEVTMDTDKKQLRVHDGQTQGGAGLIDPVVAFQLPTADNGYKWYRKYASGWIEQGGKDWLESNTITFPVTMADTNYYVSCGGFVIANTGRQLVTKYVDRITASSDGQVCGASGWLVMGMAA